ncbi:MAG TPA: HupE/UreJ family protein [Polyangiaceae bacterium]|jgi:hypothetical protein|nr:HupE/UreJ family protein [Polyangiaceae bacterium]
MSLTFASLVRVVALAVVTTVLGAASTAAAHPMPGSFAFVDFTVGGARVEQDVPIEELERALRRPLYDDGESPEDAVRNREAMLRAYGAEHLQATSLEGGAPWSVEVTGVTGHPSNDGPRALFRYELRAPHDDASGSVRLHDDLVTHEVVSHYTTVYVRTDWAAGVSSGDPQLVGVIHAGRNDVTVVRHGGFWNGFRSVVTLGMEHIATGSDHLMFLFALVLVAPFVAVGGRWRIRRGTRDTILTLARVVSAFTIGHSVTLALGAFGVVALPTDLIEASIAASILVTAVHAMRPLFPGREALIAGSFGLVHGLAFASTLAGRDLGRAQAAWTLLGFNTGIELGQLGLLFLVVPWLLVLARTRAYDAFRFAGGAMASVFATGWLLERTVNLPNPTTPLVAWMEAHPFHLLVALAAGALVARAVDREPVVSPSPSS